MGILDVKLGPKSRRCGVCGGEHDAEYHRLLEVEDGLASPRPERTGREGDQPVPVVGAVSVFAEVRRRLDEREQLGIKRYGRSLETFNGRNAFRDLEDELLDGMNYAAQARMEHAAVVEALLVLARAHRPRLPLPSTAEITAALELAAKLESTR